jgi:hypothetical protein
MFDGDKTILVFSILAKLWQLATWWQFSEPFAIRP